MPGIFDLTGFLTPVVKKLADFIPDPAQKAKAEAEAEAQILQFANQQVLAQLKVDQAEANNKNVFVAGWRPFIGWTCGAIFAWNYIGNPLANWALQLIHPGAAMIATMPVGDMMPVLLGMLGLGGMRSYEKTKGVAPPGAQ